MIEPLCSPEEGIRGGGGSLAAVYDRRLYPYGLPALIERRYSKLTPYKIIGSVLVCVAPGFSPACAALKGGATLETRTLLDHLAP